MIKLSKPVARESHATIFEQRQARAVILTLEPPDLIGLRLKGTRRTYRLPAARLYRLAVQAHLDATTKANKKGRAR